MEGDTIVQRVNVFGYYFLRAFEEVILITLDTLEKKPNNNVPANSKVGTGVAAFAGTIPYFGKAISCFILEAEGFLRSLLNNKNCKKLASLVYKYRDQKDTVLKMVLRAAVELFVVFEEQFTKATSDSGYHKAMQKLAIDAVHRYLEYHSDNVEEDISTTNIIKGIYHMMYYLGTPQIFLEVILYVVFGY